MRGFTSKLIAFDEDIPKKIGSSGVAAPGRKQISTARPLYRLLYAKTDF